MIPLPADLILYLSTFQLVSFQSLVVLSHQRVSVLSIISIYLFIFSSFKPSKLTFIFLARKKTFVSFVSLVSASCTTRKASHVAKNCIKAVDSTATGDTTQSLEFTVAAASRYFLQQLLQLCDSLYHLMGLVLTSQAQWQYSNRKVDDESCCSWSLV